jgi:site-specific DNA-cytosine methylase
LHNSHQGNDFRTVLRRLSNLGYNIAWRVLDAKYFCTAQRRRRVFIVCSLDNFKSVNVLFELGLIITEKQGLGVNDIEGINVPTQARDYYVIQHASYR